jgi:hypothetical protein
VELSTDQRGSLAEVVVAHHAARLGIGVLWPLTSGLRYELAFEIGGRLYRVQCKTASRQGDIIVIKCRSCRRTADGYDRRSYSSDDVDLVAGYCAELDLGRASSPARRWFTFDSLLCATTSGSESSGRASSNSRLH